VLLAKLPHIQITFLAVREYEMTPETLIAKHLCLRVWLQRIVLPTMLVLLVFLYMFSAISDVPRFRDNNATIVGFFAFYFVLIRGGHMIMIRSLHRDLMKTHEAAYRYELAAVDKVLFKRKSIGFTLAQIKRRILEDAQRP
jgi:hypothetical protein